MRSLQILGAFFMLAAGSPSYGSDLAIGTVNELRAKCESSTALDQGLCIGFIQGAISRDNTERWTAASDNRKSSAYLCDLPDGVTYRQLVEIFLKRAKDRPDLGHLEASGVMLFALQNALCPPK